MNHEVNANIHKIPFTLSLFYYFTETSALPPFAGGGIYSGFRAGAAARPVHFAAPCATCALV